MTFRARWGATPRVRASSGDSLLVAATTLAVFGLWAALDGGYAATVWYPAGLLLLVLAAVMEWASDAPRGHRGPGVALGALSAFTAWSYLSILWAHDRGIALTGANRTLVYLLLFFVVIRRRWLSRVTVGFMAAWAAMVVIIGISDLARSGSSAHALFSGFTEGRFTRPIEYANANAALFTLAAWPLLLLAQAAAVPAGLRALGLAAGGTAVELAMLAQSRGGALATVATLVLVLLVVRNRLRLAVPVALVAVVVTAAHGPLLSLYRQINNGDQPVAALRAAQYAIAASFLTLLAAGGVVAWLDQRLHRASGSRQLLVRKLAAISACVALAGLAYAGVERFGNPLSLARHAWHAFKYPAQTPSTASHFLTSAGNHRYDFWRVAALQFRASPLLGAGVDNFAADYVRQRRSSEEPLYPHSLEARLLGGTGAVGFLLFAIFGAIIVWRCFANARAEPPGLMGLIGGTMLLYWLIHGSVDWLWEFPGVTGPTIMAAACGAASVSQLGAEERHPAWLSHSRWRILSRLALATVGLAAATALGPAWLAERDVSLAIGRWQHDPNAAYALLRQADRFNPLSDIPNLVAGTIAMRRHDWPNAEMWFAGALQRNRYDWYSNFEEGVANAMIGNRKAALSSLRSAALLDPREPLVRRVETAVRSRRSFSVDQVDRALAERATVHLH